MLLTGRTGALGHVDSADASQWTVVGLAVPLPRPAPESAPAAGSLALPSGPEQRLEDVDRMDVAPDDRKVMAVAMAVAIIEIARISWIEVPGGAETEADG